MIPHVFRFRRDSSVVLVDSVAFGGVGVIASNNPRTSLLMPPSLMATAAGTLHQRHP